MRRKKFVSVAIGVVSQRTFYHSCVCEWKKTRYDRNGTFTRAAWQSAIYIALVFAGNTAIMMNGCWLLLIARKLLSLIALNQFIPSASSSFNKNTIQSKTVQNDLTRKITNINTIDFSNIRTKNAIIEYLQFVVIPRVVTRISGSRLFGCTKLRSSIYRSTFEYVYCVLYNIYYNKHCSNTYRNLCTTHT